MTSSESHEDLRIAAMNGDVKFLEKCVDSKKPTEYYLTSFPPRSEDGKYYDNIFHIAVRKNREAFIRKVIEMLPFKAINQLLLKPNTYFQNPLHLAAGTCNINIIRLLLGVYTTPLPSDLSERPWLQTDCLGHSPCYVAVLRLNERCALEILKKDLELISDIPSARGSSMFFEVVFRRFTKMALEIMRSPDPICCCGLERFTPFHYIHFLDSSEESKEVFRSLLQREPGMIKQKNIAGCTACHTWALDGGVWPFHILRESLGNTPILIDMITQKTNDGYNLLHIVAENAPNENDAIDIAKWLVKIYNEGDKPAQASNNSENLPPWLELTPVVRDTPFALALKRRFQKLASYILSVDGPAIIRFQTNAMFLAISRECHEVAPEILDIIESRGWINRLTNSSGNCVLQYAKSCSEDLCKRLVEKHLKLITNVANDGRTVMHYWIPDGVAEWLFEYVLNSEYKSSFIALLDSTDYEHEFNPFHVAASTPNKAATIPVMKILVAAYKKQNPGWHVDACFVLPWFTKCKKGFGPLHWALINGNEEFALYILHLANPIEVLLDYYKPVFRILRVALRKGRNKFIKEMLERMDQTIWTKYLTSPSTRRNILHEAQYVKDEDFGRWLVDKAQEFIAKKNNNEESPLVNASNAGITWLVRELLIMDPEALKREPLAWVGACKGGHVSTLRAFINHNPGKFRDICLEHKQSPLHYIKLKTLTGYENFLKIKFMNKDLLNLQNHEKKTPLHVAVDTGDKLLTEILLGMKNIKYNIKNEKKMTAADLLEQKCKADEPWKEMCYRIGFDPFVKTSYFERKTNMLDARNSLFVVAALLATITFTAGFTLPGGLNQDNGEALLTKKPAFIVFLMSNTLGMCSSMLVLICLVWSMIASPRKALELIDKSVGILLVSFYSTLLAFMSGVYIVTSPKVLWVAIFILVMCSILVIAAIRTLLYKILFLSSEENDDQSDLEKIIAAIRTRLYKIFKISSTKRNQVDLEKGEVNDEHDPLLGHQEQGSNQGPSQEHEVIREDDNANEYLDGEDEEEENPGEEDDEEYSDEEDIEEENPGEEDDDDEEDDEEYSDEEDIEEGSIKNANDYNADEHLDKKE